MRDDCYLLVPQRVDQLGKVVDESIHRIVSVGRPGAVAVAPRVRRDDMPVLAQFLRHPVPAAAVVTAAVLQNQRRRIGVAPIDIVQPQPLRDKDVRSRTVNCHTTGLRQPVARVNRGEAGICTAAVFRAGNAACGCLSRAPEDFMAIHTTRRLIIVPAQPVCPLLSMARAPGCSRLSCRGCNLAAS